MMPTLCLRNNLLATVYTTKSTSKMKKTFMDCAVYKVLVRSNPHNTVQVPVSKAYYVHIDIFTVLRDMDINTNIVITKYCTCSQHPATDIQQDNRRLDEDYMFLFHN